MLISLGIPVFNKKYGFGVNGLLLLSESTTPIVLVPTANWLSSFVFITVFSFIFSCLLIASVLSMMFAILPIFCWLDGFSNRGTSVPLIISFEAESAAFKVYLVNPFSESRLRSGFGFLRFSNEVFLGSGFGLRKLGLFGLISGRLCVDNFCVFGERKEFLEAER